MSAILGVVRPRGRPVTAAELEALRTPLVGWGPDAGGTWCGAQAGLGVLVAHRTREARHEQGPVELADGTVVVSAARLDNRDELLAELRVDQRDRDRTPDGWIVAHAVGRWGTEAPSRLLGDWSLAAWDPHERRLLLARDQFGMTSLYHRRSAEGSFVFASSLEAVLALPAEPRRLDEEHVANHLFPFELDGTATCYAGVHRLPPAHQLVLDDAGLRTCEYWRLDEAPEIRLASDADYVERFLELYRDAVRPRVRSIGLLASTLSSGLDSGSVTALAARELRERGEPLVAFTGRPAHPEIAGVFPGRTVDEWQTAASLAAEHRNVEHVGVGDDVGAVAALERSLDIHQEPELAAMNLPWLLDIFTAARERGARVLLTGQFGNGGVSWGGGHAPAYHRLRAGDLGGVATALADRRRASGEDWARVLWRGLVLPVRGRVGAELAHRRRSRSPALGGGSFVSPELAHRLELAQRRRESRLDIEAARWTVRQSRLAHLLPGVHPGGAIWRQHGEAHGFDVRDPTADVRLLEFCFGVPDEQFRSGAEDRWLLRRALRGLVPPEIRLGRERGLQGADYALRLRADGARVTERLGAMRRSPLVRSYIDVRAAEDAWQRILAGPPNVVLPEASGFGRVLQIGMFLLRADEAPRQHVVNSRG